MNPKDACLYSVEASSIASTFALYMKFEHEHYSIVLWAMEYRVICKTTFNVANCEVVSVGLYRPIYHDCATAIHPCMLDRCYLRHLTEVVTLSYPDGQISPHHGILGKPYQRQSHCNAGRFGNTNSWSLQYSLLLLHTPFYQ